MNNKLTRKLILRNITPSIAFCLQTPSLVGVINWEKTAIKKKITLGFEIFITKPVQNSLSLLLNKFVSRDTVLFSSALIILYARTSR